MLVVIIIIAVVLALAGGYFYYTRYMQDDEEAFRTSKTALARRNERANEQAARLAIAQAARKARQAAEEAKKKARKAARLADRKDKDDDGMFSIMKAKNMKSETSLIDFCKGQPGTCLAVLVNKGVYMRVQAEKEEDLAKTRGDFTKFLNKYIRKNPGTAVLYNAYDGVPVPVSLK